VNKFETKRLLLKIEFAVAAVLLPIVLPLLAPSLGIHEGGRISLGGTQVVYAVLSVELALAVYIWGVGNWSRFEPPQLPSGSSTTSSGPAQTPKPGPAPPASLSIGPTGQRPGTPAAPQGGR